MGRGWGGVNAQVVPEDRGRRLPRVSGKLWASTPTQPSPIEGEGFFVSNFRPYRRSLKNPRSNSAASASPMPP